MLRKVRIFLALVFFVGITLLFLDVTGVLHLYLGWMAKVQLLPAILSLNFILVAAVLLSISCMMVLSRSTLASAAWSTGHVSV